MLTMPIIVVKQLLFFTVWRRVIQFQFKCKQLYWLARTNYHKPSENSVTCFSRTSCFLTGSSTIFTIAILRFTRIAYTRANPIQPSRARVKRVDGHFGYLLDVSMLLICTWIPQALSIHFRLLSEYFLHTYISNFNTNSLAPDFSLNIKADEGATVKPIHWAGFSNQFPHFYFLDLFVI